MADDFAEEPPFPPLLCQLWFDTVPSHDNPLLRSLLEDAFAHVDEVDGGVAITHEALIWVSPEGDPGWGSTVIGSAAVTELPSLEQTWLWPQAADALAPGRGMISLTEVLGGWVDPLRRVEAFRQVLRVVVEAMRPRALVWPGSDVVTDPADLGDSLLGFVNVRRTRSAEAADGWIVDTLGLERLNIPDLEIHARGLDPDVLSDILARHAEAFVRGSEFIAEGDPVMEPGAGPDGEELWFTARYLQATAAPTHRRMVALVPPPAFALGTLPPLDDDED